MTTAAPSTALATIQPAFTDAERVALAGFLAGYRGLTREAYALDLRQFTSWCRPGPWPVRRPPRRHRGFRQRTGSDGPCPGHRHPAAVHHRRVLQVRRGRRAPGPLAGRPCPPSAGRLRVSRGRAGPQRARRAARRRRARPAIGHALISLLALNGLRVSEATGADIEHLGLERGHRTLTVTRKGGKVVTVPLAPRTARAIDLAIGERTEGPVFLAGTGGGWTGTAPGGSSARRPPCRNRQAVTPHTLRHAFITAALDAGVPLRDVQEAASHADPRTTMRYDRAAAAWTGTRPTSSPPTSRVPPGNPRGTEPLPPGDARGGQAAVLAVFSHRPHFSLEREPPFWTPMPLPVPLPYRAHNGMFGVGQVLVTGRPRVSCRPAKKSRASGQTSVSLPPVGTAGQRRSRSRTPRIAVAMVSSSTRVSRSCSDGSLARATRSRAPAGVSRPSPQRLVTQLVIVFAWRCPGASH